ncbi:hypothetical protein [Vermiculatibacterium agrestimuris]|uniref:hypothetical protein n=1 Tax=Vermiculatibacterium agrestimuris TaxID=2941519 RepID=UPI00203B9211|nr:hypothetical protein [Vermiculatibacterium agrestimuris]
MRITGEEFGWLTAVNAINSLDKTQPEVVAEAHAENWAGTARYAGRQAWPDWVLVQQLKTLVVNKSSCYAGAYPDIGEEDIDGKAYTGEDPGKRGLTDLSYIGRPSLLGKVAGELLRRLQLELELDQAAQQRRWTPPETPP